jgi:acyl-CoA thioesterase
LPSETPVDASQDDYEYESPFARLMSMRDHPTVDGVGLASMTIKNEHRQIAGVVQGGIIVALADYAFHLACRPFLRPGQIAVTVELKTNFLAPAVEGELTATARVVSSGRRIIVCDVDVIGDGETLIARSLGTYMITGQPT